MVVATFIAKCTPSLGRVSIWWARMTEHLIWPNGLGKAIFYLQDKVGGEIAESRNSLVAEVLNYHRTCNPVSDLFWLDDDVLPFQGAVAELYRRRWAIEGLSLEMAETLNTEPQTLAYPKPALLVFCLALLASNAVALLQAAVRAEHGAQAVATLSAY